MKVGQAPLSPPARSAQRLRRSDTFATPAPVARFLCRTALREHLLACHAGEGLALALLPSSTSDPADEESRSPPRLSPRSAEALLRTLLACRVCDPAVGDGALLLAMFEEMHAFAVRLSSWLPGETAVAAPGRELALRRQLVSCLHGADIQEQAVRLCRSRLQSALAADDLSPDPAACAPDLSRQLVCADSLLGRPFRGPQGERTFDIVLANPPYVSFGLRGVGAARAVWAEQVRQRYPRSAEYKLSTYALFMDRGLSLTRPGGVFCCLTPDSYLLGRYFSKLRRLLLDGSALRALYLIEEDFWEGGVVGRPVIGVFRAGRGPGEQPVLTAARCRSAADLARGRWQACPCPQADFARQRHHRFRLLFSEEDRRFVAAVEHGAGRLGEAVAFASGLIGRHGRGSIVADARRGPTWRPGIDSGADVLPYRARYRGKFLNFEPRALKSGFRDARYDAPKLLLRQTGDALVAAYDADGLYCLNNVHVGRALAPDLDVRVVVALLNSALLNRYYRLISLEEGRALAQIDLDVLADLPFKRPAPAEEQTILRLVALLHAGPTTAGGARALTRELEAVIERVYLGGRG
jgi:adenine-specific DNA-methyltransferase